MPAMKSPEGDVKEIVPGGVAALTALGWELVKPADPPPKQRPVKPNK